MSKDNENQETRHDTSILYSWTDGNPKNGEILYKRYDARLRRFFQRKVPAVDIDDTMQQTWTEFLRSRAKSLEQGTLSTLISKHFRAYLYGVARHVLLNYYQNRHKYGDFDEVSSRMVDLNVSPSSVCAGNNIRMRLDDAMRELPLELQILAEFRYRHDLSYDEIALACGVPVGTVRSRLARTKKLLQSKLGVTDNVPSTK